MFHERLVKAWNAVKKEITSPFRLLNHVMVATAVGVKLPEIIDNISGITANPAINNLHLNPSVEATAIGVGTVLVVNAFIAAKAMLTNDDHPQHRRKPGHHPHPC